MDRRLRRRGPEGRPHQITAGGPPRGLVLSLPCRRVRVDARRRRLIAMPQLKSLIDNWLLLAQGLIGSIGALAFLVAFLYKIIPAEPRSVMEAQRQTPAHASCTIAVEIART